MKTPHNFESYVTSVVRPIPLTTREERANIIREAKNNIFNIASHNVMVDLLTDSGTGAISNAQLAEIILGDESYAGSASFEKMKTAIKEIAGFDFVIPTHQGRAAENVLCSATIKEGDVIPGNSHFDTTKGHIEFRKAVPIDCTIDESFDPYKIHPFKGNLDLNKLEAVFKKYPKEKIPFTLITVTCNTCGGQPVSMENIHAVKHLCKKYGIPLFFDMARFAENAFFIKTREPAYKNKTIREICLEMFQGADGATMSAKKDAIVAMGGFLALNHKEIYQKCSTFSILFEGFLTYGGMSGGTMGALAQGLYESTEEHYLATRVGQVERFGQKLQEHSVPILVPTGGHAIYIDALKFLPHIPRNQYPGQALVVAAYVEGGVRCCEIGTVLADRDPVTHQDRFPKLELVRLAIPRRMYSENQLNYVADVFGEIYKNRNNIHGLKITYEAPVLRHFTCEFETIDGLTP